MHIDAARYIGMGKFVYDIHTQRDIVPLCMIQTTNTYNHFSQGTWILFGTFCALTFFFVWFLIPETKGMSLEKMDELFGITDDFLRIMDENQRERAASTMGTGQDQVVGLSSLLTTATASEKRNTGSSNDVPVYRV